MKKILIISPVPTHPPFAGNSSSILAYAQYLTDLGHEVHFLYVSSFKEMVSIDMMKSYWGKRLIIFNDRLFTKQLTFFRHLRKWQGTKGNYNVDDWYPWRLSTRIRKIQNREKFDIVWTNYVWLSKSLTQVGNAVKVIDTHDVFTDRNVRANASWFSTTGKQEKKALDRADYIVAMQEEEATFLRSLTSKQVVVTYRNSVIKETPVVEGKNLLFFASGNKHNLEAIRWFMENVFTELKKTIPEVQLLIGGSICDQLSSQNVSGVSLLGKFNDIREFYNKGNIAISPVFEGTGLKIKIFEALSFGKILVTHPHNIIGVPYREDIPVFIANTKDEYINIITSLLNDISVYKSMKIKINDYMDRYNRLFDERMRSIVN